MRGPDTLKLINAVKMHKWLYDTEHPHYRLQKRRNDAWDSISRLLQADKRACQAKWKSLRDHYVKLYWYYKNRSTQSDDDEPPPAPWRWYSTLSFLESCLKQRNFTRIMPRIDSIIPEEKIYMRSNPKPTHRKDDEVPIKEEHISDDDEEFIPFDEIDIPIDDSNSGFEFETVSVANNGEETITPPVVVQPKVEEPDEVDRELEEAYEMPPMKMKKLTNTPKEERKRPIMRDEGFIQMMESMLNRLTDAEKMNSKMFILNYLHEKLQHPGMEQR